jgi:hypothetical protein
MTSAVEPFAEQLITTYGRLPPDKYRTRTSLKAKRLIGSTPRHVAARHRDLSRRARRPHASALRPCRRQGSSYVPLDWPVVLPLSSLLM